MGVYIDIERKGKKENEIISYTKLREIIEEHYRLYDYKDDEEKGNAGNLSSKSEKGIYIDVKINGEVKKRYFTGFKLREIIVEYYQRHDSQQNRDDGER